MELQHWFSLFIEQLKETSFLTWVSVILSVAEVLLAWRNNVLLYPAGIISTVIYIYIMADAALYAEATLNIYYLVMSIYGWLHWLRRRNEPPLPITKSSSRDWGIVLAIIAISWAGFYFVLKYYTNSTVPIWDGWVSATAGAGMWLLARRKMENWLLLNLSNLFAIPLLLYKKLPLPACLTLFLFIVAIFGYFEWRKIYRTQKAR